MKARARSRERGDGMVSYLMILALVVLVCVTAATNLGTAIKGLFTKAEDNVKFMNSQMPAAPKGSGGGVDGGKGGGGVPPPPKTIPPPGPSNRGPKD